MDTRKLNKRLADQGYIAILWHISGVKEVRSDLTDDQAREVLHRAKDCHDANYGICWDTLTVIAGELFGYEPDESEADTEEGGAA